MVCILKLYLVCIFPILYHTFIKIRKNVQCLEELLTTEKRNACMNGGGTFVYVSSGFLQFRLEQRVPFYSSHYQNNTSCVCEYTSETAAARMRRQEENLQRHTAIKSAQRQHLGEGNRESQHVRDGEPVRWTELNWIILQGVIEDVRAVCWQESCDGLSQTD